MSDLKEKRLQKEIRSIFDFFVECTSDEILSFIQSGCVEFAIIAQFILSYYSKEEGERVEGYKHFLPVLFTKEEGELNPLVSLYFEEQDASFVVVFYGSKTNFDVLQGSILVIKNDGKCDLHIPGLSDDEKNMKNLSAFANININKEFYENSEPGLAYSIALVSFAFSFRNFILITNSDEEE